MNQPRK